MQAMEARVQAAERRAEGCRGLAGADRAGQPGSRAGGATGRGVERISRAVDPMSAPRHFRAGPAGGPIPLTSARHGGGDLGDPTATRWGCRPRVHPGAGAGGSAGSVARRLCNGTGAPRRPGRDRAGLPDRFQGGRAGRLPRRSMAPAADAPLDLRSRVYRPPARTLRDRACRHSMVPAGLRDPAAVATQPPHAAFTWPPVNASSIWGTRFPYRLLQRMHEQP